MKHFTANPVPELDTNPNPSKLIPASAVRETLGGVSDMTLWRWLQDEALSFPRPIYIGRRRYFREAEIHAWIEERAEA